MNKRTTALRMPAMIMATVLLAIASHGQWVNDIPTGSQSLTNPTDGVTIGTTAGTPPSALTVLGDEMDIPTGEVFRTDAPNASTTSWRLFRGGTEYGHLFNEAADSHFLTPARSPEERGDPAAS